MEPKRRWSPVKVGVWLLLAGLIACATPPVPSVPQTVENLRVPQAKVSSTRTLTPPREATVSADETPGAEDADALTRAIVSLRRLRGSSYRALNFCELPQGIRFENRERVYCLHPETISFDGVVTSLGEVMNARFGLRDQDGNALAYDEGRRCEFNLCYAHIWYDKQDSQNAFALLRVYPLEASGKQVAPLLEVKPNGNPQVLTDWQVVLVDRHTAEIVQLLPSPFVPMARSDAVAFNASSGYFEVLDRSGSHPRPTGKRLGLPFALEQVTQLAGDVEEVALYDFNRADIAYFENALAWLRENMPDWYEYFLAQRPLEIYHDGALPFVSDAICCRTREGKAGIGRIRIRDHLSVWTQDAFPGASHDALARWSLLTLLIHEITHVRDLRLNRFDLQAIPLGMRDCVVHLSADEIEIQFSQHAAQVRISPSELTQQEYVATIEEFYRDVQENALVEKQKLCGEFYKPRFEGLMP